MAEKKKPAAKKPETKAEASARIQKELLARGAKIQTTQQIAAQRERASKKQAQLAAQPKAPAARGGNGAGKSEQMYNPRGYTKGKQFDADMGKALRKQGAD